MENIGERQANLAKAPESTTVSRTPAEAILEVDGAKNGPKQTVQSIRERAKLIKAKRIRVIATSPNPHGTSRR
jgi:hypothetical protein